MFMENSILSPEIIGQIRSVIAKKKPKSVNDLTSEFSE